MASHTPGVSTERFRHRITNIKLNPPTATRDISLKILIDGQEAHRLPAIVRDASLCWDKIPHCEVNSNSRVEIRVYEKHFLRIERVGTLTYAVPDVTGLSEASLDFDTKRFKAVLSFPTLEAPKEAPATALAVAQAMKQKTRPLERLGPTRAVLKAILNGGEIVSELHPAAKIVVGFCKMAWQTLENQEQCDANVEKLVVDLANMLPFVDHIEKAAKLPQLQNTVEAMKNLIEDASEFVVKYKSDDGPVRGLRAVIGSEAQDQVQDLLGKFKDLKESFDRGVDVQTLATAAVVDGKVDTVQVTVDAVREVLVTDAQRVSLKDLDPVGSAQYDSTRACLPGTRTGIIEEIADWCEQDTSEALLWVHGQAGLGKSSIATSVCQRLEKEGNPAIEFFCKRDDSKRCDPQRLLTTVIYGLAHRHSGYAKSVAEAIQGDSRLCSSPIQKQYDTLIKAPLNTPSLAPPDANLLVVVDALDECGTPESRRQLLAYLHLMSRMVSWLKIVVTSRPDPDIQSFFNDTATTGVFQRNLYKYNASEDIRIFIQERMLNNHQSKSLPSNATDVLTKRAAGLFIWAKTACELILNDFDPESIFNLVIGKTDLNETTNPLDDLYATVIETSVVARGAKGLQHVVDCLGAIIVCSTREPLSVTSLSELLGAEVKPNVLQSVVDSLSSVLYTDTSRGGAVRVYHHSFTDYMTSSAPTKFRIDLERRNTDFAVRCLRTMIAGLKFNICGLETSHIPNSEVSDLNSRVDDTISLHLRYSCQYWTSHLTRSERREPDNLLKEFLLGPMLVYWIEVLSLLGKLDVAMFSALELSKWCQGLDEVSQCAKDIYRFIMAFYDPISKSTPHLYLSALAFCPRRTAFIRRLGATFQNTLAITRGAKENWSPWLRCISHPSEVRAIAVSKDGRRIVSGSEDGTVRLWDTDTGEVLGDPLIGHSGCVWSVEFSHDGHQVVSGSEDMMVRVWDADTGKIFGNPFEGHLDWVNSVGFSPDGHRIVSGSADRTVRVWEVATGKALGNPFVGHTDAVLSVAFSPDDHCIVSGSKDRTVRLWNADTGEELASPLEGHSDWVMSVVFSPDSRFIVSGSYDKTVRVWNAKIGETLGDPFVGHSDCVRSVDFSPDGRRIVSGSYDFTVRVWDASTGKALGDPLVGHSGYARSVRFSLDGRRIISGSADKTIRLWDADTHEAPDNPLARSSNSVAPDQFSPHDHHTVPAISDRAVRLWDADTEEAIGKLREGYSGTVMSVGFSPDGRRIVSGSDDNTVRVWDADTSEAYGKPFEGHSDWVRSVGFSPDGRRIVSGSFDRTVRVWDADTGEALGKPFTGHSGNVWSVGFSPDGRHVVSGSEDKAVRLWDADTGEALGKPFEGHSGYVYSVGFSPDGLHVVSSSSDKTVRVWDANTSEALGKPFEGHSGYVYSVGFSPDGRRIVSGSFDKTVRVWDANTGEALGKPFTGHSDYIWSVGFSPDGRHIVSGSGDNTVRVWDADTGEALGKPFEGHSSCVYSVGFSPDGRRIVSGSSDQTVRVWDSTPTRSTSLPHNTSRMFEGLSDDGWVRDTTTNAILIWLPEEYRRYQVDDSLFVIAEDPVPGPVMIDSSKFVHGTDWASIYTPQLVQ